MSSYYKSEFVHEHSQIEFLTISDRQAHYYCNFWVIKWAQLSLFLKMYTFTVINTFEAFNVHGTPSNSESTVIGEIENVRYSEIPLYIYLKCI